MKKLLALILALSMILALCACGKSSQGGTAKVEETPVPEYVYKSSYKELAMNSSNYLQVLYVTSEGFYASYNEVVGQREHEGEEQQWEGQFDIYEPRIIFVSYDGKITPLSGFKCVEPLTEGKEGQYEYEASTYVNGLTVSADGKIYVLETMYEYWLTREGATYEDADYWDVFKYAQKYFMSELSSSGEKLSTVSVDVSDDEYIYESIVTDKGGNFILTSNNKLRAIDSDGEVKYTVDIDGFCENVLMAYDGTIYVTVYLDSGSETLYVLNQEKKTLEKKCDFPQYVYDMMAGGGDYPIYYNSGVTFYGFDPESGEESKLFNWIDLDINGDSISRATVLKDGRIVTTSQTYDTDDKTFDFEIITVDKVPYSSVPQKVSLKLATLGLSYEAREAIVNFNRKNDTYHIDVIDYSEYNNEENYSAGLEKMTTEILAGNIPDIIDLSSMPASQFASKGILEDLYPYIDRDFNRADFFENVLKACEINGKLYTTIPGFSISTVIGASSVVGDEPGWTYAEFNAALASMPDGCTAFEKYITRESIMSSCLGLDMADFVNWETGEVNFDCQEFIDLLKFVNTFPESFDWDNYDYIEDGAIGKRIASGEQMLEMYTLSSVDDVTYSGIDFGGTAITYVGFPTNNGTGNTIYVNSGFAMSSTCSDKEGAWSFLRQFFTEDYQKSLYNFPIIKSLFEKKLNKAMTPDYITDSNGNILLDENGEKIMSPKYVTYNSDGEPQYFYCLSEQQGEALRTLVTGTTKMYSYDESISNIVNEEAQAFFSGQKTAEEVARLVQSKVNIYVNEQR